MYKKPYGQRMDCRRFPHSLPPWTFPEKAGYQAAGRPWIPVATAEAVLSLQEPEAEDAGMGYRLIKDSVSPLLIR